MNFVCFGLGAIGSYIGGSLLNAGHQVVFIRRKDAAYQLPIIVVRENNNKIQVKDPIIVDHLSTALKMMDFDYGILAVKSYDTDSVIEQLSHASGDIPPLLCFQNGIDNEEKYAAKLGQEKVIPCTVTTAVQKIQRGHVVVEKKRGVGVGMHPNGYDLNYMFNQANLNAKLYKHPVGMKWSKLITNLLANASSAIMDWTPEKIFHHKQLYKLEVMQVREAVSVVNALSYDIVNLPGTPVVPLVYILNYLPPSLSRPLIARILGKSRGSKMPSLHIDLKSGKGQSEVTVLNGAVARMGLELDVPTPVNLMYERVLISIIEDPVKREAFAGNPEKLVEIIGDKVKFEART